MVDRPSAKVLYITYLGLLEPIPKSQVLPYILELSGHVEVHLLSFEKRAFIKRQPEEFRRVRDALKARGIAWHRLPYHKYPLVVSSALDILLGTFVSFFIVLFKGVSIVHARSNIPIAIGYALKSVMPIKLLYDRRGIMGEDHLEHSGWKKGGFLHRLATRFEAMAIRKSDAIVVLTDNMNIKLNKGLAGNRGRGRQMMVKTIPCCIDLGLFRRNGGGEAKDKIGLSGRFVFVYSGSVGTYNLLGEMFDFFKEAVKVIPQAHFLLLSPNRESVLEFMRNRSDVERDRVSVYYASQERLPLLLSAADAGLVFRRTSATALAASPTKFGEYLACEVPVVSTPGIGDLEEIINSNKIGVVLRGYGEAHYREAIGGLLNLLADRDALKKRCRQTVEGMFSLGRGVDSYLSVYNYLSNA